MSPGGKEGSYEAWRGKVGDGVQLYHPTAFTPRDEGLPGGTPFIRGLSASPRRWRMTAPIGPPFDQTAKARIEAALEAGAQGLEIRAESARSLEGLEALLEGVDLSTIELSLAPHRDTATAARAMKLIDERGATHGNLGLDPAALADKDAVALAQRARRDHPDVGVFRISAERVTDQGGSPAEALTHALTSGVACLKALDEASISPITFSFALGSELFASIALVRAFRACWASILESCQLEVSMRIVAVTSKRSLSTENLETNILRGTVSALAAAAAGVDGIVVEPFDAPVGPASPAALRLAVTTQHILEDEAFIARTVDPAGGCWLVQDLTQRMGEEAWHALGDLEEGGSK